MTNDFEQRLNEVLDNLDYQLTHKLTNEDKTMLRATVVNHNLILPAMAFKHEHGPLNAELITDWNITLWFETDAPNIAALQLTHYESQPDNLWQLYMNIQDTDEHITMLKTIPEAVQYLFVTFNVRLTK